MAKAAIVMGHKQSGSPPYRICFVFAAMGLGGAEKQLAAYMETLPPKFVVNIIYFNNTHDGTSASFLPIFRKLGAEIIHYELSNARLGRILGLVTLLRKLQPTIVHSVLAGSAGTWGRLAAWLAGVPYVFHSDRSLNPPITRVQSVLRPFVDSVTSRFLPNANATAEWLRSIGVNADRVRVVHNGVDLTRFIPSDGQGIREAWGISTNAVVAGFLGKFRPEKRLDLLLDAVLSLPEVHRPDYLVLGGDGPRMMALKAKVEQDAWLRARCRFVGLVEDVPAFLAGLDYLILCSDREGMPNVVLEAMAMAKPVVATNVSEVPAIIDGVGFLAEVGNTQSLASAIVQMQTMTLDARARMGLVARERVLANWDMPRAAERFWAAHSEVLQ